MIDSVNFRWTVDKISIEGGNKLCFENVNVGIEDLNKQNLSRNVCMVMLCWVGWEF